MDGFGKKRAFIESVDVENGIVVCNTEDADSPGLEYPGAIYGNINSNLVSVPPIGAEVLVEQHGGDFIITNVLSIPSKAGMNEDAVEKGAESQQSSAAFVFDPRDGSDKVEKFSIEYTNTGYKVTLDVDEDVDILSRGGDINLKSEGGNINIVSTDQDISIRSGSGSVYIGDESSSKKVLTEDAVFEYEDTDEDGNTSTKITSKVSNEEATEVELE